MGQAHKAVTADQALASNDLGEDWVSVPEWGGEVKVQGLSVKSINAATRNATVAGEIDAEKIAVAIAIAGTLEPQFSEDQAGQLAEKSMAVINRIVTAIYKLSGVDDATLKANEARFPEGSK